MQKWQAVASFERDKKKSNLFLSAFFLSLCFYRREEDQEGDEEDEDEKNLEQLRRAA